MKKIILNLIFIIILAGNSLIFAECTYDWQAAQKWYSSNCQQYFDDWNTCNSYDVVCANEGNDFLNGNGSGSGDNNLMNINFLNGLAGLLSAFLIWQAWNNANK